MVECLQALYSKFPAESVGERIFNIGEDFVKVTAKVWGLSFLEHGVYTDKIATFLVSRPPINDSAR